MLLSLNTRCFSLVHLHTCSPQYWSAVFPCLHKNYVIQSYIITSIQETAIFTLFNFMNETSFFFFQESAFVCLFQSQVFSSPLCLFQRVLKCQTLINFETLFHCGGLILADHQVLTKPLYHSRTH